MHNLKNNKSDISVDVEAVGSDSILLEIVDELAESIMKEKTLQINKIISSVGNALKTERISIYRYIKSESNIFNSHQWHVSDKSTLDETWSMEGGQFPEWIEELAGKKILVLSDSLFLKRTKFDSWNFIEDINTALCLVTPLYTKENDFIGFIVFKDFKNSREWHPGTVLLLKLFSRLISRYFERLLRDDVSHGDEFYFKTIFERAGIGCVLINMDGNLVETNSSFEILIGQSKKALKNKKFNEFIHEEDIKLDDKKFDEIIGFKRDRYRVEKRIFRKYGEIIWVSLTFSIIRDYKTNPQYILVFIEDITRQKKTKIELKESKERFQILFNRVFEMIIMYDKNEDIVDVNESACRALGFTKTELLYRSFKKLHPESEIKRLKSAYKEAHEKGIAYLSETMIMSQNGETIPVEAGAVKVEINGEVYIIVSYRNITDRKEAEEIIDFYLDKLQQSNNELKQFAYIASHDLQEPLRVISSYLGILNTRAAKKLDEKEKGFIENSIINAERMRQMIRDLLDYSRISIQGAPLKTCNTGDIIDTALEHLKIVIKKTETKVIFKDMPEIFVDKTQIVRLFQNLISNGIKYSQKDVRPKIKIEAVEQDDKWLFTIQDNGIGIKLEYKERIFQIFQRLHVRNEYSGTGIGLAVCKKIIERHLGRIWIESEIDKGSTFYFTIPKKEEIKNG